MLTVLGYTSSSQYVRVSQKRGGMSPFWYRYCFRVPAHARGCSRLSGPRYETSCRARLIVTIVRISTIAMLRPKWKRMNGDI